MNVSQLKELLEDLPDEADVRLATQPNWPFESKVNRGHFVDVDEMMAQEKSEWREGLDDGDNEPMPEHMVKEVKERFGEHGVLYLGEGRQIGYLPGMVKEEIWG